MDLVFVLDESMPVVQDPESFDKLRSFMLDLTDMFTISYTQTRVAAIGYGRTAKTYFHFFEPKDATDLKNRIRELDGIGGARNTAEGLEQAYQEIITYSRQSYDVPVYLIHIAQYAHDVGDDPALVAQKLGKLNVTIFATAVLSLSDDATFQSETARLMCGGGPGSMEFNASTYKDLIHSGIREQFQAILNKDFVCKSPPKTVHKR